MSTTQTPLRPTARDGFVRGRPASGLPAGRLLLYAAALGLVGLAILVQFGENGIFAFWDLQGRRAELQDEVAGLEAANTDRREQLQQLAGDPEVLERIARERHNMQRQDEEVLMVLPAPAEPD